MTKPTNRTYTGLARCDRGSEALRTFVAAIVLAGATWLLVAGGHWLYLTVIASANAAGN